MQKKLSNSQSTILCFILLFPGITLAELPIGNLPAGLSWTITYKSSDNTATRLKPKSPEHSAALELHQRKVPRLLKSEAYRYGDEFIRVDYYENKTQLQTYINPRMFIEEARSGDQILASSRDIETMYGRNMALIFFPELACFDQAKPQGVVTSGEYAGKLKFTLSSDEDKNYRQLVEDNLRDQGIQISLETQEPSEKFVIMDSETKLPVAFFDGSTTAVYEYHSAKQRPELTEAVRNIKERIENP